MIKELVSIIIPSFNSETYISETIDSILNQTYPYWEAIVVDDGSSDETCSIVKRYSQNDKRIQLFLRVSTAKGASVCRNIGIEKAIGKYIIFLDSDDLLAPFCLKERYGSGRLVYKREIFPLKVVSSRIERISSPSCGKACSKTKRL